jgi:hypothetical protein
MNRNGYVIGFGVLLFAFLLACSSERNPFRFDEITQNAVGILERLVQIGTDREQTVAFETEDLRYNDEYLLGDLSGERAEFVVRWGTLLSRLDSARVISASVRFAIRYWMPESLTDSIALSIHTVNGEWDEETVALRQSFTSIDEPGDTTLRFMPDTTMIVVMGLPARVVEDWLFSRKPNYGLYFKPASSGYLISFGSDEHPKGPVLIIHYEKAGNQDSLLIAASEGVTFLTSTFTPQEDRLVVGNSDNYATFFYIDEKKFPDLASINSARLILQVDTTQTLMPPGHVMVMTQMLCTNSNWEVDLGQVDSTAFDTTHYRGGPELVVDVTRELQQWMDGQFENHGLRLAPRYPGNEFFRIVFHSSAAADSTKRPRLEVYYTRAPQFGR